MTLSPTSASRGIVLPGSFTHPDTASKWKYSSTPSPRLSLSMGHLALAWPHSSLLNPPSSIWRISHGLPPVDLPCALGSAAATGLRACRQPKFSDTISLVPPCNSRTSFENSRLLPARTFACVVLPTYDQSISRGLLRSKTLFLYLPVSVSASRAISTATVRRLGEARSMRWQTCRNATPPLRSLYRSAHRWRRPRTETGCPTLNLLWRTARLLPLRPFIPLIRCPRRRAMPPCHY